MFRLICAAAALAAAMPAYGQDDEGSYGEVIANTRAAWIEPEGSGASEEEIAGKATYFVGNIGWLTMHEFGHALVSEFQLPILGKEEDSVDNFATINMIADDSDPGLEEMISDVIDAWFNAGLYANLNYGAHSVDEQRAYAVVCMLVGHDPEGWKAIADDAEMPEDRQQNCHWEFEKAERGWETVLSAYEMGEDEAPTAQIAIEYNDAGEFGAAAELLRASGVLEQIAGDIERKFKLPNPLTVSAELCGQANAFYVPSERKVKVCYELANFFLEKAQQLNDADGGDAPDDAADDADAPQ